MQVGSTFCDGRTGEESCVGILLDAVGVSLSSSSFIGAEAAAITSSEYLPLADGNSEAYSVDGIHILTHIVVRGATLIIIPRR
jgi:hypothetical protein